MRIGHCIHGLGLGGAQKVIATLVRGAPDCDRHFVYSCSDGALRSEIEDAGAGVRIVPRSVSKFDPTWIWNLSRAMRRDSVDLIHTHLFGDSLHGYLAARMGKRIPVVMTIHNRLDMMNRVHQLGYRWLFSRSICMVACSRGVRESMLSDRVRRPSHKGNRRHIHVIPNGIERDDGLEQSHTQQSPEIIRKKLGVSGTVIAAIGRLERQKGHRHLIDAFSRIRRDRPELDVVLLIVGEGSLMNALITQTEAAAIGDRVRFLGFEPNVRTLLKAVDIVVFSSLYEGLPIALLEAMADGKCIVGTNIPGISEAVLDGKEGLLASPERSDQLSDALLRAIEDRNLRRQLGDRARERFRNEFTASKMVQDYLRLYQGLLSTSGNSGAGGMTPQGSASDS